MRQVVRRVIDPKGRVRVVELPEPHVGPNQVLVQNHYSLISSGTELSTLGKTPVELVRQTIADPWMRHVVRQTVLATGLAQTTRRVWQEMVRPRVLGYSGAGRVLAVGNDVHGLPLGGKVAYAATGHADLAAPYVNHVVAVPESVDLRHAAFVTVGGIAIQSLRRAEVQFGEVVAVYGLGLVGQLCALIAKAAGCVVVGVDIDERRNQLARDLGADLVVNPATSEAKRRILDFTQKRGVDATVLCARSRSAEVVNTAMEITRRQGRVVIVGYVKLSIHPKEFLYRELDLRYSRAYGPGSYHGAYEKGRVDYPFGYVRWTEKRNLEEFVRLVASGAIRVDALIGGEFGIAEAQQAFDAVARRALGGVSVLLRYEAEREPDRRRTLSVRPRLKRKGAVGISIIGCGNQVLGKHLPNLRGLPGVEVRGLASATGLNASMVARAARATVTTTDAAELFADPDTDAVMICSSQPEHCGHIGRAIEAGKAIYIEKPMVTRLDDFRKVVAWMESNPVLFTLGLNRRYSPLVVRLRELLAGPVDSVTYLVSQPYVPPDHWTLDEIEGGGRLITEGEHFIDLCHLLIGHPPLSVEARALGAPPEDLRTLCNFALTIYYEGAVAHVVFDESGAVGFPREQVTVQARGQVAVLDDFARLTFHSGKRKKVFGRRLRKQMGHREALEEFVAALRGEPNRLATWQDAANATLCMFAAQESIRSGGPVDLREFGSGVEERSA